MRWNKRDKVWSSVTSLFTWGFRSRRRRCCLSSRSWARNASAQDKVYSLVGSSALSCLCFLAKQTKVEPVVTTWKMFAWHLVLKRLRSDGTEMYQNAWSTCLAFVCWSILIRCRRIVRGNFSNDHGDAWLWRKNDDRARSRNEHGGERK